MALVAQEKDRPFLSEFDSGQIVPYGSNGHLNPSRCLDSEKLVSFEELPVGKGNLYKLEMANHRATIRYQCAPATASSIRLDNDHEYQRGWVQNLSVAGIGLLLSRPISPTTHILVILKTADGQRTLNMEARVIHSTQQPSGDWVVGCEFSERLSEDDLDQLLY